MPRRGSTKWRRINGSSPIADIDPATQYQQSMKDWDRVSRGEGAVE